MRLCFLIILLSSLSACGGGGGGSSESAPEPSEITPPSTDPLSKYINIEESYLGNKNKAEVTAESIGSFFNYFFFINPELLPSYFEEREPEDIGLNCIEGGTVSIYDTDDENEKNISFTDCGENGAVMTGDATILANAYQTDRYANNYGEAIDTTLIFKDVSLKTSFGDFQIIGTMSQKDTKPNQCPTTEAIYNMVFDNANNDQQVYFSNVKSERAGVPLQGCSGADGIVSSGTIYDSTLGYWFFGTSELFRTDNFIHYYLKKEQGEVTIFGANDSKASWAIKSYLTYIEEQNLTTSDTYYELIIDGNNDGVADKQYQFLNDYFSLDFLTSLADSDSDGMTDLWEEYFGLDPNDPDDATLDMDNDGFTNIEEFNYLGDPNNDLIKALIGDLSIYLEQLPQNLNISTDIINVPILLNIDNLHSNDMRDVDVTLKLSPPFSFSDWPGLNNNCTINDLTEINCTFENLSESASIKVIINSSIENSLPVSGEISATISTSTFDKNIDNNVAQLEYEIDLINASYLVANGRPKNVVLTLDEVANFDFRFTHMNQSITDSLFIELESPSYMQVIEAKCKLTSEYSAPWTECLDGEKIDFPNTGYLNTHFVVQPLAEGQGYLTMKIKSTMTGDMVLKEIKFPVIFGRSSNVIQQQINSAASDTQLIVESGIYVGNLEVNKKENLIVKSVSGPENTFLYGHLNSTSGSDPIRLGGSSNIEGFTISGMPINVENSGASIINNVFDSTRYNLRATHVFSEGPLDFLQNKIFIGYQLEPTNELIKELYCSALYLKDYNSNEPLRLVNIVNNLLVGVTGLNDNFGCPFIKTTSQDSIINIDNNTFVSTHYIVEVSDRNPNNIISARNNIFSNTRMVFQGNQAASIIIENNLFHKVFRKSNRDIVEYGTINGDPMFDFNWELLPGSAAIDTGITTNLMLDLKGQERPVDGNNDGTTVIDIGAFEYQGSS